MRQEMKATDKVNERENPRRVITSMSNKNKKRLTFDLKVREALEIRKRNCGPGHGLNEDYGAYVKTTMWNPVFHRMGNDL